MSEILALEWEHEQVCGVKAHVTPGRVRIDRTFVIPKPIVPAGQSGMVRIDWLKPELARLGIFGGPALVALPRDEAIVRRIELPEVSDDELPVMVRFQAGAKSSVSLDELSLDFIPLPKRGELPGREVLMATVPRQTIDEVQTVCETAGLQPISLGLTAAAIAEFVARAEGALDGAGGGESLVVARHGNRVEISVLRRCHLLFAHSARLSDEATGQEAQAIVAEVSRALVALRGALADVKIERAWTLVSAAEHEQLAESLHRRLSCEVLPLDPFASVELDAGVQHAVTDRSLFAGPIGMLLARSDARVPGLDFLSPRQPPVKHDTRKRRAVLAGAGALVLVALLGGYQWMRMSDLKSQVDELTAEEATLDAALKDKAPAADAAALIAQWEADGEDWLDELSELAQRMPPTDRVYLKSMRLIAKSGTAPATIKVDGLARERKDALELNEKFLATGDRYQGLQLTERPAKDVEFYAWSFDKLIRLKPAEPERKEKTKAAPAGKTDSAAAPEEKPAAAAGPAERSAAGEGASS